MADETKSTPTANLPREARHGPIFHPDFGTHAYAAYLASRQGLDALLGMVFPIPAETPRSERALTARRLQIENDFSGPWSVDVRDEMLSWQVAMQVSAVEVYLQNALTFLAVHDPEFIRGRGSKQEWDYDIVRAASDNDETLWTFCNRWARSFIGDGGPTRWSKALERSGVGRFQENDVVQLEEMWGYRHMRVHHGGGFTREFVSRHPSVAERLHRDGLAVSDLIRWKQVAAAFVSAVEAGIAGRLRGRLGESLIQEREDVESQRQMGQWEEREKRMRSEETPEQTAQRVERALGEDNERFALMRELFGAEPTQKSGPE